MPPFGIPSPFHRHLFLLIVHASQRRFLSRRTHNAFLSRLHVSHYKNSNPSVDNQEIIYHYAPLILLVVANHLAPYCPLRPNPLSDDASRASSSSSLLYPPPFSPSPSLSLSLSPSPFSPLPHSILLSHYLPHHLSPISQ